MEDESSQVLSASVVPFVGIKVDPTGRIVAKMTLPRADVALNAEQLPEGWRLLENTDDLAASEWWIDAEGVPQPRPHLIEDPEISVPADGATIFSLELDPATQVNFRTAPDARNRIRHEPVDVTDGVFEFVTAVAGIFEFDVEPPFPLRPLRLRITAHAV